MLPAAPLPILSLSRSARQAPAQPCVSEALAKLWAGFPGPGLSQAKRAAKVFYFNSEDFTQNLVFSRFKRRTCTKPSAQWH